jgi:hypothetical protein
VAHLGVRGVIEEQLLISNEGDVLELLRGVERSKRAAVAREEELRV